MGISRSAKPVHCFCGNTDGRVKTKREVGSIEIVVHCFGDTDNGDSGVAELFGSRKAPLTTDRHDGINLVFPQNLAYAFGATIIERVSA